MTPQSIQLSPAGNARIANPHMQLSFATQHAYLFDQDILLDQDIWLGLLRTQCQSLIAQKQLASIDFAHWLSIPQLNLLLTFKRNQCVAVDTMHHMIFKP